MSRTDDLYALPENLPVPADDGACAHLLGHEIPAVTLLSTQNRWVSLAEISLNHRTVVYCYPRTGQPDREPPVGWNQIPGARGCTPQSCGFRDHISDFVKRRVQVFGLSTQPTDYQQEMVKRLKLPFEVLSDADLAFTRELRLPTFEVESMVLLKRLTLVIRDRRVEKVFYPVFPPDRHAMEVLQSLEAEALANSV